MNCHTRNITPWRRAAAVLAILLITGTALGCHHIKHTQPAESPPETSEASAVYTLACTGMVTAKTIDQFTTALSAMDQHAGLDFSGENPAPLIKALRHGTALMEKSQKKAHKTAGHNWLKQKELKQKIKALEKEVATLKHQISVLENIDQERREKRKTQ